METFLEVYGTGKIENKDYDLDFCVFTKCHGVTLPIIIFTVTQDGSVFGCIDHDFCTDEKILEESKKAILASGLKEIIGDDLASDKIFKEYILGVSIDCDLCQYPNKERWTRAREYIQNNGIVVYGPTDLEVNRLMKK